MNEYVCELRCRCPKNAEVKDFYIMTLRTYRMIEAESILAEVATVIDDAIFQEELTLRMAVVFDCECTLEGTHSNVAVRSTWGTIR